MLYHRRGLADRLEQILSEEPRTTLKEASSMLKVERHTLESAVKESKGTTFRELQQLLLLNRALELLSTYPNLSIKEIAFKLGYRYPRDFARFIRNSTGRSPTEIRNER
jgi:AraC-like DNA-binding protein